MRGRAWVCVAALGACASGLDAPDDVDFAELPLSPDNFQERFAARFCEEMEACDPLAPCEVSGIVAGNDTGCVYDSATAEFCMTTNWPCVGPEGQPHLEVPYQCAEVWVCD